jgi:arabinogalactan endo-1,4-beta-galactosidase
MAGQRVVMDFHFLDPWLVDGARQSRPMQAVWDQINLMGMTL